MAKSGKLGGFACILFVLCFFAWFALSGVRESLGFSDADNPGVMMNFLKTRIDIFVISGILFFFMGILLVITILTLWEIMGEQQNAFLFRFGVLFAGFAAVYFFVQGVLRIQAPGTLLHMGNLNPAWGEAGYLAVQMAGNQGLGSAGAFAVSIWAVSTSFFNFKEKVFWRGVSWLGLIPLAQILGGVFGPLLPSSGLVYSSYILGIFSTYIWCLVFGLNLVRIRI